MRYDSRRVGDIRIVYFSPCGRGKLKKGRGKRANPNRPVPEQPCSSHARENCRIQMSVCADTILLDRSKVSRLSTCVTPDSFRPCFSSSTYLAFVVGLLVFSYLLNLVVNWLNLQHLQPEIPEEFEGWYDDAKYAESQAYLKERTRFDFVTETFSLLVMLAVILPGGFGLLDRFARGFEFGLIGTGLIFTGTLVLMLQIINLPFSWYSTFVIEEKYGFNKTTLKTFIADLVKGAFLGAVIGGLVLALVLWFFASTGANAWWICWIAVIVIMLFLQYLAPVVILPLFNRFTPLEAGELRREIESYAAEQGFSLSGIFTMDGSKRSSKSNAFFTGFGKNRRIALFDTLIEKHTVNELVSVLAHEMGHYKLRHIHKMMLISFLSTGLMFFILKFFLGEAGLYEAFGVNPVFGEGTPVYAGLVFFGFLFAPISMLIGIATSIASRKHEFEADAYAVNTRNDAESMVIALKKLSRDNLSNLTPHPLLVFLEYSHPPVLERIRAIRKLAG